MFDHETSHVGHDADRELRRLAARRAVLDAEEARWLVIGERERVHEAYGFGSFVEYCERILGYRPHTTRERLRVARALVELPATADALDRGAISYTAVRELTRVATPTTERAWLDAADGVTVRELEDLVAGHVRDELPTDPADPALVPRVLRFELSPDAYAMFLEARRAIADEAGAALDDSATFAAICERACRGDAAGDRAPFQIALTVCARCDRATQDAAGQVIAVAPSVVERARCDAEHLGALDADAPSRLTTDIPPATRRLVRRRDHDRCAVPGCRASRFVDLHHVVTRASGGDHAPSNLTLLCGAHHRAVHEGRLRVTGRAPDQLRFTHADDREYGTDACAEAVAALRGLGFAAPIAKRAVERAASHVGRDLPLDAFLRACLRECPRPSG